MTTPLSRLERDYADEDSIKTRADSERKTTMFTHKEASCALEKQRRQKTDGLSTFHSIKAAHNDIDSGA